MKDYMHELLNESLIWMKAIWIQATTNENSVESSAAFKYIKQL